MTDRIPIPFAAAVPFRVNLVAKPRRAALFRAFAFGAACLLSAAPGRAEAEDDVVKVREITIVGRIQKPIAAVDVSRIQPKMTLAELRQPFLDRIERAIYHAPF